MTSHSRLLLLLLLVAPLLPACVSDDTMFFGTKTSIGIDVSATPPTFDLAFARKEMSVGPVIEKEGEAVGTLPVMSSFGGDGTVAGTIFGTGVSTQFATGRAAEIITRFLESPARLDTESDDLIAMLDDPLMGTVAGERGERCYVFATDTVLGLGVEFAAEAGGLPAGIAFGWKRKELAIAPIVEFKTGTGDAAVTHQAIPSLIATSAADVEVNSDGAGVVIKQFYATGKAADYLSTIPAIRKVVGAQIALDVEQANKILEGCGATGDDYEEQAGVAHANLSGTQLDEALALMRDHKVVADDRVFDDADGTPDEIDDHKRTQLNLWSIVFNDCDEVERLGNYVEALSGPTEEN
ncbi:hypothetical protein DRQ53_07830 [bacterium]|nr:MAG: hypothetical protein DRQ53_07830 [bacterium]